MAVLIIEDLVSRKWITEIVSVEETSTQVELAFTAALEAEGLLDAVEARHDDGRIDLDVDDQTRPILLAVSDNGAQMTSGSTREFMALCAIAQHFGRPGTPTDQAWVESFNGHLKGERPYLTTIEDPAILRAELATSNDSSGAYSRHSANTSGASPDSAHPKTSTNSSSASPGSNSRPSTCAYKSKSATKTSQPPAPRTAN